MKQHVIGILDDLIKIRDYVLPLFIGQGLLVFLLQILFEPASYRIDRTQHEESKQSPLGRQSTRMIKTGSTLNSQDQLHQSEVAGAEVHNYSRQTLLDIILRVE